MERKKIKQILLDFGYSEETVKKMFQLKTRPTLLKAIELQETFKIPCIAWVDIKSYVENDTKKGKNTSRVVS
jgi:predicted transcriptional regulator